MNSMSRKSYRDCPDSPQPGLSSDTNPVFASKWNGVTGEKYTILWRVTLLLSAVAFLQGYLNSSSHFMVNHMDTAFRLNQGNSAIDYTKNRHQQDRLQQYNVSSSVLSTSIITNFHYVYASDTYPQTEGSESSDSISGSSNNSSRRSDHLFRTNGFSKFARGWIVCMLLGQAMGSAFAWKFTDTVGRKQTILLATSSLLVLLCVQVLLSPDMGSFTIFSLSPVHKEGASTVHFRAGTSPHSSDITGRIVDISFRTSFYVLSWGLRFLLGLPLGVLLVTAILYASELPLPQERGRYMATLPLAYLFGTWLALVVTLVLHHHVDMNDAFSFLRQPLSWKKEKLSAYSLAINILGNEWRWHLLIPIMCCVAMLVGFRSATDWLILTPESPYWLLANDSTTMPTKSLISTSSKKKTSAKIMSIGGGVSAVPTETSMDAFTSLLFIRGGGKSPTALRDVHVEFANMYRALAQDAVSDQSWRDLCLGASDISLRYRLLLLWILIAVQVMLGPYLLFEMSTWFSLLLLGRDPYLGGDDDDSDESRFVHYELSHYSFWLSLYPSDTYLFEGVLASCVLLSAIGGVVIGREYLDPVVLRSGYSHGESIGRRSLLLTGISFIVLFVMCFVITIHFHDWKYNEIITMRNLFWEYLIKYLCFGWLCFICLAYYFSIGLTMWILPVEVWGLRYRSKCLSSCYVVYFLLLALSYLISFWWHSNGYTEKGLEEQALKAPTSLQRNLLEYAALITFVGVYVFLALPETTGLMFEDSDALFSLEEYDVIGFCFPRGTGTGYLGFRTFDQINMRFHIYFVPPKPKPSHAQMPPLPSHSSLRSSGYAAAGGNILPAPVVGIAGNPRAMTPPIQQSSQQQDGRHPPVPIMETYEHRCGHSSDSSSVTSLASPQSQSLILGVGPRMSLIQARGPPPGYGSASSTPTKSTTTIQQSLFSAELGGAAGAGAFGSSHVRPYGSALFLPELGDEELDETQHMFHEHKYSTPLRSSGFQYLDAEDKNEGASIHTSALFHTEKARPNSHFSNR